MATRWPVEQQGLARAVDQYYNAGILIVIGSGVAETGSDSGQWAVANV